MYGLSERKVLPPELQSRSVVMLTCHSSAPGGFCDVYLVGTHHDSKKSSRQVGDVIKFLQPQVVFLELCWSRRGYLYQDRSECNAAYKEAMIYGGELMLGDRPYSAEECDDDDDDDDEALLYFSRFPTFVETVIHERDQYMSAKLLEVARKHNSVVAVVGEGHLAGIRKNWKQPVDMEELVRTPPTMKIIPKLVAGVAIIGGVYLFIKMS